MSNIPLSLHIGGMEPRPGWKILNIQPGPGVDFVGSCTDLSQFANGTISEIYASHVLEHLSFQGEIQAALREMHRVLIPGGTLRISVPDFERLAQMFLDPSLDTQQRYFVLQMIFGGQLDHHDLHKFGFSMELMGAFLRDAGFLQVRRVDEFNLFRNDCSTIRFLGIPISLNVIATR